MNRASRTGSWAGIVFAVLFVAGFFITGETPDYDNTAEWETYFDDSGTRAQEIIGAYMMMLSAFAFLWFARTLVGTLVAGRSTRGSLADFAQSASTLFAAMVLVALVFAVAISAGVEFGGADAPDDANFGIYFEQAAFGLLLVPGCLSAAGFIAAVSALARGGNILPAWLVWAGFVAAVLLLFGAFFIPLVLIPLWVLAASIVLLMRGDAGAGADTPV